MLELLRKDGPFRHRNVRLYTWFTVLYNARAYYPVFAIFFLDLGLTLENFVVLNAVWAGAILLLEVPSGALADTLGRKKLIVFSAALMIVEMALLLLAPANGGWLLLGMCFVNRILSGTSEAAASGADQALAFDTLAEHQEEDRWDDVLATVMRWRSAAFFIAMLTGAVLYDAGFLNRITGLNLSPELTHRLPIAMVFIQSLFCLYCALRMTDPLPLDGKERPPSDQKLGPALKTTLKAAKWVFTTPLAFQIVLGGLLLDSVVRNFVTLNSEYYRLIDLPVWTFGFFGAITGAFGFFLPILFKKLSQTFSTNVNLALLSSVVFLCFLGIAPAYSYFGVIPVLILFATFGWMEYLSSRTLNALAASSQRATILSVKGLAFNLGYGSVSLISSGFLAWLTQRGHSHDSAFLFTLKIQPFYLLLVMTAFFGYLRLVRPKTTAQPS